MLILSEILKSHKLRNEILTRQKGEFSHSLPIFRERQYFLVISIAIKSCKMPRKGTKRKLETEEEAATRRTREAERKRQSR